MAGTCLCHPYFLILPFREQKHAMASYFLSFLPAFLVKMPFHPFKLIFGSPNHDFRNQSSRKPMAKRFSSILQEFEAPKESNLPGRSSHRLAPLHHEIKGKRRAKSRGGGSFGARLPYSRYSTSDENAIFGTSDVCLVCMVSLTVLHGQ